MKLFLTLPFAILMSCQSTNKSTTTPKTVQKQSIKASINKKWMLTSLKTYSEKELTKNNAFIEFNNGKGSASVGCNTLNFPVNINEKSIEVTNLFSTRMLCKDLADLEKTLSSEIKKIKSYTIDGNKLILKTSSGSEIIAIAK